MMRMTMSDDFDQLIDELHSSGGGSAAPSARRGTSRLERWLHLVAAQNGSDLLLVAGAPPSLRIDGRVQTFDEGPLDGVDIEEAVLPALSPYARRLYLEKHITDSSFRIP